MYWPKKKIDKKKAIKKIVLCLLGQATLGPNRFY